MPRTGSRRPALGTDAPRRRLTRAWLGRCRSERTRLPLTAAVALGLALGLGLVDAGAWAAPSAGGSTGLVTAVVGRYIVRTAPAAVGAVSADVTRGQGRIHHRFSHLVRGFSATMPADEAADLRRDPRVQSVTLDVPTRAQTTQSSPPWGLDRLDQRPTTGDGSYGYDTTGAGVTVFVVDTGIRYSHTEFGGRASSGYDFVDGDTDAADCAGHGTHVSGTVGGEHYGVAKNVHFVSLRVWDCTGRGWMSDMIAALNWVVAHPPSGRGVVNISGGGAALAAMNDAVAATTAAGIPVVVAAGNDDADACQGSPGSAPSAITVGASTASDTRAFFSNYGPCVDLWAPGVGVLSSVNTSDTAAEYWDGTSMATPHVTGSVARYLQAHPTATPGEVSAALLAAATPHAIAGAQSSNDGLLYVAPPPDVVAPQVVTTFPAAGATGVSRNANVTVTFSEPMDHAATAGAFSLRRVSDGAAVSTSASWSGAALVADPVSDLLPGVTYEASVGTGARDGAGIPLAAAQTWQFTVAATSPSAPTGVAASTDDVGRSATLSWAPPIADGGGAITGYRVDRNGTDANGTGPWDTTVPATARTATFLNLVPGQTYRLTVRAINGAGDGPGASVTVTMAAPPPHVDPEPEPQPDPKPPPQPQPQPQPQPPVVTPPTTVSPITTTPTPVLTATPVVTDTPTVAAQTSDHGGGATSCVVPRAKGMTPAAATKLLQRHRCRVKAATAHAYSATVKAGRVVRTTPSAGSVTRKAVQLVVSRGPQRSKHR